MLLLSIAIMAAATAPVDDSALSCSQIATLTTELQAKIGKEDEAAARRAGQSRLAKGLLGGLAKGALTAAPSLLAGQGDGWGGYAAQQALGVAASSASQALDASAATPEAPAQPKPSPSRERLDRLAGLSANQGC